MKKILEIKILCGDKTCASEPGKFCEFVGSRKFGLIYTCMLFPTNESSHTDLKDKDGHLMRCEQCLKNEKRKVELG